jgi:hypothetical protein
MQCLPAVVEKPDKTLSNFITTGQAAASAIPNSVIQFLKVKVGLVPGLSTCQKINNPMSLEYHTIPTWLGEWSINAETRLCDFGQRKLGTVS